jgi:hypothetical protein
MISFSSSFAQAAKLTTATLPIARVKSLCAQCKGPLGALSLSPNTLIFDEYVQVVAAFAAYHQPDAYAPFEVRYSVVYWALAFDDFSVLSICLFPRLAIRRLTRWLIL